MKEQFIKIFAEQNMSSFEFEINNYLKNNSAKIISISYTCDSHLIFGERALVVFEKE